jgi:hypothetical protein
MTALHRVNDSTVCTGRKNGAAKDSDSAQPKAEEIVSKGAKE